jgi:phospholipid/cholesterol/gamma-HCH transport system substrate-binding protein
MRVSGKSSSSLKVGILTIVSLIILILAVMWLKGRAISTGQRIEVAFRDVDGLRPGSAVQMMGIRVGQIEEIIPVITSEKNYVKLKFVITEQDISIPHASEVSIQQSGIIGEKFLEITPPRIKTLYMPAYAFNKDSLAENDTVEMIIDGNYHNVGKVKNFEILDSKLLPVAQREELGTKYMYKVDYIITMPGLILPDQIAGKIIKTGNKTAKGMLRLIPDNDMIVSLPEPDSKFTIIEPMRLKDFLDLQLAAAKSLNETNIRINALLTSDVVADMKQTLKNIRLLSDKANTTLDKTALLIDVSREELKNMMAMAGDLSGKMAALADNLNNIVGDPEFKDSLISTTKSINESAKSLSVILSDKKMIQTMDQINTTTKNLAEISSLVNDMTKDEELKAQFKDTLVNLNVSLEKLSTSLENVNSITAGQEENIKKILLETSETSQNLNKFSEKLNKRFLLIRLLL